MRLSLGKGVDTHRLLGLFHASFDLLQRCLDLIIQGIYLLFADNGDRCLGGELLGARPAQAAVPSHSVWAHKRAPTMGGKG